METSKDKSAEEEIVKEIASIAWRGAANAFRMYPENKHTFAGYWYASKSQFAQYASLSRLRELGEEKKDDVIDFATWYSGMERDKVINAYKRYQKEKEALKEENV